MESENSGSSPYLPSTPSKEISGKRVVLTPLTNRSCGHNRANSRTISQGNESVECSPTRLATTDLCGTSRLRLDKITPRTATSEPHQPTNGIELVHDPTPGSFVRIRHLKDEGCGEVIVARELDLQWITGRSCGRIVALKVFKKKKLVEQDLGPVLLNEFNAYQKVERSRASGRIFIMWPRSSFDTPEHIVFLMDFLPWTLSDILMKDRGKRQEYKRRWIAQMVRGITALHSIGLIHRDIRPENILLDGHHNVRIGGFACVYVHPGGKVTAEDLHSNEITGTWPYLAPEIVKLALERRKASYSAAVDYWSLGCIVYELESMTRKSKPMFNEFRDVIRYDEYQANKVPYPPFEGMSENVQSLIYGLVCTDPDERMGNKELKQHPYFKNDSGASEFNKLGKAPSNRPEDIPWVEMDDETARQPVVYRPLDSSTPSITEGKVDFSRFRWNYCTEVPVKKRRREHVLFSSS